MRRRTVHPVALLIFASVSVSTSFTQSAPTPKRVIPVADGILLALIQHGVLPTYPQPELESGTEGKSRLEVWVDPTGVVEECRPLSGDPNFVATSIEALKQFRFQPYLLNGVAVYVHSSIGFDFAVKGRGKYAKTKVKVLGADEPHLTWGTGAKIVLTTTKVGAPHPRVSANSSQLGGDILIRVAVSADGQVEQTDVVLGVPILDDEVVDAVKQWTYEPRLVLGKPTPFLTQESFHFGPR